MNGSHLPGSAFFTQWTKSQSAKIGYFFVIIYLTFQESGCSLTPSSGSQKKNLAFPL